MVWPPCLTLTLFSGRFADKYSLKGSSSVIALLSTVRNDPCVCSAQHGIEAFLVWKGKRRAARERPKVDTQRRSNSHRRQLLERAVRDAIGAPCRARLQGETPELRSAMLQLVLPRRTGATVRVETHSKYVVALPSSPFLSDSYLPGRSYGPGCQSFVE